MYALVYATRYVTFAAPNKIYQTICIRIYISCRELLTLHMPTKYYAQAYILMYSK